MESSPYDEEYKLDDEDETSQVDLYTPSPRTHPQVKKERSNEVKRSNFVHSSDIYISILIGSRDGRRFRGGRRRCN